MCSICSRSDTNLLRPNHNICQQQLKFCFSPLNIFISQFVESMDMERQMCNCDFRDWGYGSESNVLTDQVWGLKHIPSTNIEGICRHQHWRRKACASQCLTGQPVQTKVPSGSVRDTISKNKVEKQLRNIFQHQPLAAT